MMDAWKKNAGVWRDSEEGQQVQIRRGANSLLVDAVSWTNYPLKVEPQGATVTSLVLRRGSAVLLVLYRGARTARAASSIMKPILSVAQQGAAREWPS